MGYDHGDSLLFDFELNGIQFGSENRKKNCHHDHIPFDFKGNCVPTSFLTVQCTLYANDPLGSCSNLTIQQRGCALCKRFCNHGLYANDSVTEGFMQMIL